MGGALCAATGTIQALGRRSRRTAPLPRSLEKAITPSLVTPYFLSAQLDGVQDGLAHASRVCQALPGNIEGGAVIRRGAGDRQAEGDIHAAFEGQHFEGDQALVVIHADVGRGL